MIAADAGIVKDGGDSGCVGRSFAVDDALAQDPEKRFGLTMFGALRTLRRGCPTCVTSLSTR
jgi:hypothetical protein